MKNLLNLAEDEAIKLWDEVLEVFKTHKDEAEVHVTADKQLFLNKTYAENHSVKLGKKDVVTVTRAELDAADKAAADKEAADKAAAEKAAADKAAAD